VREPTWLEQDIILALHTLQIKEHGGSHGLRDENLLLSAIARPRNLYHYSQVKPDMAALSGSYAVAISQNHPFIDGNKRTALGAALVFLDYHSYVFSASMQDRYIKTMQLAAGELSEEEFASWIRENIIKV
jgi:death on curing protein